MTRPDSVPPDQVPEKIKKRLYPVVMDFFAENDFHQVNIRKISQASGLSTGTIYKYYHSKEELILDILEEKIKELKRLMVIHDQGLESARERFHKAFWVLLDAYDRDPGLAISFFITVPTRTWMQRESYSRYDAHELFSRIADQGRERGEIEPSLTNSQVTGLFFMHLQREVNIWYYRGRKWKLAEALDSFFPLFWKAVQA